MLCCAMLLALCAPAGAKVLLLNADGSVVGLAVRDPYSNLVGWTDDGTALLVRRNEHALRLDLATGATAPQPLLDDAVSIGPGGRAIVPRFGPGGPSLELREADGRVVGVQAVAPSLTPPSAAWSRDGTRVAVALPPTLPHRARRDLGRGGAAHHARASLSSRARPSHRTDRRCSSSRGGHPARGPALGQPIGRAAGGQPGIGAVAAWGPGGQVAVTHDDRVRFVGMAAGEARLRGSSSMTRVWNRDGSALTYALTVPSRYSCGPGRYGVGLLAPGGAPRTLVAPSGAPVRAAVWSPDGQTLAVDQDRDFTAASELRGKRHPWPRRIARDYEMFSRRGDAAIRRIVLHASRELRRGAGRAETLGGVSDELERVAKRFDEAHDTAVEEALANELDEWLHAAGFARIESRDEFTVSRGPTPSALGALTRFTASA